MQERTRTRSPRRPRLLCTLLLPALLLTFPSARLWARGAETAYQDAMDALDERQWREAVELLEEVEQAGGRRADAALYWQGYALGKMGRIDQAMERLERLISEFPRSEWRDDARGLIAEMRSGEGRGDEATAHDEELKLLALTGLLQSDPERAAERIEKFLEGDHSPEAKERALFLMIQTGDERALAVAGRLARDGSDRDLQRSAIHYLGISESRGALDLLDGLYRRTDDAELREEILAAYMMAGERARIVAAARGDADPEVRETAISLLGSMGATEELAEMWKVETDLRVREALLQGFMVAGDPAPIVAAARGDRSTAIREQAVQLLGAMGASAELEKLYAAESSLAIRETILHAFMVAGDEARVLAAAREESSTPLRESAVNLLGVMGARDALWSLYEGEKSVTVRSAIVQALAIAGDSAHLGRILREDPSLEVRSAAVQALGVVGGPRAGQELARLYEEQSDREIKQAVMQGLFVMGDTRELIRIARVESDRELKTEAVRFLSMMDTPESREYMLELLDE